MNLREFYTTIRETGEYHSPSTPERDIMDRIFWRLDSWYYLRMFQVVISGARSARKGLFSPEVWGNHSLAIYKTVEKCGGTIEVKGIKNVADAGGPAVIISNHMSMLETMLIPALLLQFNWCAIVVKESLLNYPVFGHVMRAVNPISVTRKNPRDDLKQVMNAGKEYLNSGRSVVIFPQATRSTQLDPDKFNSLGSKLAAKAGVPVIPLALKTDFLANGRIIKDFGPIHRKKKIRLEFAPSMKTDSASAKEINNEVIKYISERLEEWKDVPDDSRNEN